MVDKNFQEAKLKIKIISDAYAQKLPEKLAQINEAWALLPTNHWDEEYFQNLHRMVHSLAGSGKTFGYSLLGEVAHNLETYLDQIAQLRRAPIEGQRNQIEVLLRELLQVTLKIDKNSQAEKNSGGFPTNSNDSLLAKGTFDQYWSPVSSSQIYIVEDDIDQAELMKAQLSYYGYEITVFTRLEDFRLAMQSKPNVVVLMDVTLPESKQGGINTMKQIQREHGSTVPVIFLSAHNDFETRLECVRAGSIAFQNKPVNIATLVENLDMLTSTLVPAPYRILIIDDSEALTAYYAAILEHAGMEVRIVNNPLEVMTLLLEFTPDLILLDLYMPKWSGMELAKAIRQLDLFVSIPIVFLSAGGDFDIRLSAMGLGADDFLTKPIQPQHLVSIVSSRVQRSLKLRSLMLRDSLTGLLNHTAIKDQLAREVAQAKRRGTSLSFAMVDIDNFKHINDAYGHQTGDEVIQSISRIFKQQLRETDVVGRYGGEEFAIILSNTDGPTAIKVLDKIRMDFSGLRHVKNEKEFSVTFSCGVSDMSHFEDATKLCLAADMALYKAKNTGRNNTVLAEAPVNSGKVSV